MALKSIKCPECGHEHGVPEPGTRKITCESCGMIVVMKKVLGEDWEKQLEAAASGAGAAKAAPKKSAPVVKRRGKAAADDESSGGGRKRPTTRGSSRRRPSRGSSRRGAAEAEAEEPEEGRRRRPTGSRPRQKESMPPALLFGSIIAFIAIGAVLFLTVFNKDDESTGDQNTEQASTKVDDGADAMGDPAADEETNGEAEGDETTAAAGADDGEKPAVKKEPVKKKPEKYSDFESTAGTTDEELAAINKNIETLRDINATREAAVAMDKLGAMPKKAIPHLINALFAMKPEDKDDVNRGWQLMQALQVASSRKDDWDRTWFVPSWPEDLEVISSASKDRSAARKYWWRWWDENKASWEPPKEEEEDW